MLYTPRFDPEPGFLYFTDTGDIYARISCRITVNTFEYIPSPAIHDIVGVDNASGGKDFTINLRVIRDEPYAPVTNTGSFIINLFRTDAGLNEAQVRDAIDKKVYNLTIDTHKAGALESSVSSQPIDKNSDIDIE